MKKEKSKADSGGGKDAPEIYRNEIRINARMRQAERFLKPLKELCDLMQTDGIICTKDNLEKFMSQGPDFIKRLLKDEAAKAIKTLKLKNSKAETSLIGLITTQQNDSYIKLYNIINEKQSMYHIPMDAILVLKGEPMLSEKFKNEVEQEYSATLNTEQKQKFWDELKNLCDSFNRAEELAQEIGLPSLQEHLNPHAAVFMQIEERGMYIKVTPNPAGFVNILEI